MPNHRKNSAILTIYDGAQSHVIEGLQLLNATCNNAFFATHTTKNANTHTLFPDLSKKQVLITLKGIYMRTTAHEMLRSKAFSSQTFEGMIIIHDSFQLTGVFAISRYSINHDLSTLPMFNIDLIRNEKVNGEQI